jgi:hypothetical protein
MQSQRVFRYVEFAHRCRTQFVFGQELWLIVLHEGKQAVTAASSFLVGLFRELLLSVLHERMPYVMQPGAASKCTAVKLRQITKKCRKLAKLT